jgi:hypothetical protein
VCQKCIPVIGWNNQKMPLVSYHVYTLVIICQGVSLGEVRNAQSMSNIIDTFSISCHKNVFRGLLMIETCLIHITLKCSKKTCQVAYKKGYKQFKMCVELYHFETVSKACQKYVYFATDI